MNISRSKRVIILILFLFILIEAKAQSDFRPGYVITLQGDTVNGLINYRKDLDNSKNCIFKNKADQESIIYTPDQIRAYRFKDGKYYISSNSLNHKFENNVFVEHVSKGAVSIYYYKDDVQEHLLVSKDTLILELDNQERRGGNPGFDERFVANLQLYKRQLKYLMQDQPSLLGKVDRTAYSRKDLIALAKDYQELDDPSQNYLQFEKNALKDITANFGVFFSTGLSHLSSPPYNIDRSDYEVTKYLDFGASLTYEVGAMLNLNLNFMGENKYMLQLAPALNFTEYDSYTERELYPLLYSYKLNIRFTTLKVPLNFKYSFYRRGRSVIPFIKFGPGASIYLNQKGIYEYRSVPLNGPATQEKLYTQSLTTSYDYNPVIFYFSGGTGVDIKFGTKLLFAGAIFEYGPGMLDGYRFDAQLQLGHQF